ncbi:ankyrin repeat domain-containing protein [Limnoraphis robusta Tam1]|uniref:Ankyrin repeat domain-containing protein n=1 Tax=Limnoraphis robusta CCNP1315 TaxID=3110306 RepID=A0ABU5U6S6_9CYAN|nr:ankyrin repeat domain-containing protein [Limnoraphis robusta]MEA5498913.1 ankyrin repeat domain-containing protein [Limnoraphis robusta BA-68 BA1]MEA5521818.1 ankyrin repeat domain-containing protein [Limnoraphis robusta CCNP1315]MEA5540483.1 ankyrin repeat domain-containing protein [Limnoraphis robusta Tam1]MEA5543986.1 ankyrin repeat domain-containing protein [Limnoraphis robusta CCNP1324]
MDTQTTTQILRQWFESWAEDDVEAVIEGLSETVVFYAPQNEFNKAIPYLGKKVGKQAVVEAFEIRAETTELLNYDLLEFIVEGNKACIISHTQEICKQTQQIFELEDAQFIVLDEAGKIASWSFYFDPNPEVAAFKADFDKQLIQAVKNHQLDAVKSLLDGGANVNFRDPQSGLTVLMIAASQANVEMVKLLLNAGADVYMLDSCLGSSVLHQACQGGSAEVVKLLVEAGAFIDAVSATGKHRTPLQEALFYGHNQCAEILLNAGANLISHSLPVKKN